MPGRFGDPASIFGDEQMNFSRAMRLIWIDARLAAGDCLRRKHIMEAFGVSVAQASSDLHLFKKLFPDLASYDVSAKCYTATRAGAFAGGDRVDILTAQRVVSRLLPLMSKDAIE